MEELLQVTDTRRGIGSFAMTEITLNPMNIVEAIRKYFVSFQDENWSKYLNEAEAELQDLEAFAAEEDLPPPNLKAKGLAKNILDEIVPEFPRSYAVSPWEKGSVTIQPHRSRITIFCDADGSVSVFDNSPGNGTIERHAQTLDCTVMHFIREALRKSKLAERATWRPRPTD